MRLKSLDALRGIAALIVVFYHAALAMPGIHAEPAWLFESPLRLLVSGPAAVVVFFVLSGVVLSFQLSGGKGLSYASYMATRVARIWLPFVISILLSVALGLVLQPHPAASASDWLNYTWRDPIGWKMIVHHLVMDGRTDSLNNPMWSLIHEMRISLVFPFLVVATRRSVPVTMGAALLLLAFTVVYAASTVPTFRVPPVATCAYFFLFVAGITIAIYANLLRQWMERAPGYVHAGGWGLGLGLIALAPAQVSTIATVADAIRLLVCGLGACLIVLLCLSEHRAPSFLLGRVALFLGRISYSLYLLHVIVMAAVIRLLDGIVPIEVSVGAAVVLSFPIAAGFHHLVEAPAGRWGKAIAQAIEQRRQPAHR